jgi:hypothetical protein
MNKEAKKKNESPASNFLEPQPKGKVDKGDKAVRKPGDKIVEKETKIKNPAKYREESEQPVHSVKK